VGAGDRLTVGERVREAFVLVRPWPEPRIFFKRVDGTGLRALTASIA